jgi:hypothetical protein
MLRRWFGTDYEEIHPITKAKNVYATNDKSMEEMVRDRLSYGVASGSASALTVTLNPVPVELEAGFRLTIKVNTGGTGQTLNVNGIGAKAVKKASGRPATLVAGGVYTLVYDGTAFILQGEGGGIDLTGSNAVPSSVMEGETFFSAGTDSVQVGTMTNYGDGGNVVLAGGALYEGGLRVTSYEEGFFDADTNFALASSSIAASKVLAGQNFLGLVGTATNDANAVAADILIGKTAYVNGSKLTGTKDISVTSISAPNGSLVSWPTALGTKLDSLPANSLYQLEIAVLNSTVLNNYIVINYRAGALGGVGSYQHIGSYVPANWILEIVPRNIAQQTGATLTIQFTLTRRV